MDNFSFSTHLAARAGDTGITLTKGERTRLHLKAAAARILETKGYHAMQMGDIAREAGLSQGAVYKYFENKKDVTVEVLTELIRRNGQLLEAVPRESDAYRRIVTTNRQYIRIYSANVGLMRCLRQLSDEIPEFNELWLSTNAEWYVYAARGLARRNGKSFEENLPMVHALGAMVDEFLHEIFVRGNKALAHMRNDIETLAGVLSHYWYRMAYAQEPSPEKQSVLRSTRRGNRKAISK